MIKPEHNEAAALQAHDYLYTLGNLSVRLATVERATRHPNGDYENDVEHSYHLGLTAAELAAGYYPDLNTGLVAEFSLVHDMPEVYSGDVWTLDITDAARAKKEADEKVATDRLLKELPPHTANLLRRYEAQEEPEARFVRFVDKLLPAVMNVIAGNPQFYKDDHNLDSFEIYKQKRAANTARLQAMFPEFPFIHQLRDLSSATLAEFMYGRKDIK